MEILELLYGILKNQSENSNKPLTEGKFLQCLGEALALQEQKNKRSENATDDESLLKGLNESRQLMSDTGRELSRLSQENKDLRIMLWRMVQNHGTQMQDGKIDAETFDKILSSTIYMDDELNVRFSNVLQDSNKN